MLVATFIFSVVAALAASTVAYWAWVDRPRYAWGVKYKWARDPNSGEKEQTATVQALGSAVADSVEVRVTGGSSEKRSQMSAQSEPIVLEANRPADSAESFYLEIYWRSRHPLLRREHGQRIDLRTLKYERWRWTKLRTRKQLEKLPVQCRGHWSEEARKPVARIPRAL
ncbi:hypothetical protein [Streptomyces sp. NPDC005408]|uniref:hypothetical protein n=1 Tax=Streptomyces sp. NPDC005408 TaxID=3155341 RepID=UPI0033B0C888